MSPPSPLQPGARGEDSFSFLLLSRGKLTRGSKSSLFGGSRDCDLGREASPKSQVSFLKPYNNRRGLPDQGVGSKRQQHQDQKEGALGAPPSRRAWRDGAGAEAGTEAPECRGASGRSLPTPAQR